LQRPIDEALVVGRQVWDLIAEKNGGAEALGF